MKSFTIMEAVGEATIVKTIPERIAKQRRSCQGYGVIHGCVYYNYGTGEMVIVDQISYSVFLKGVHWRIMNENRQHAVKVLSNSIKKLKDQSSLKMLLDSHLYM